MGCRQTLSSWRELHDLREEAHRFWENAEFEQWWIGRATGSVTLEVSEQRHCQMVAKKGLSPNFGD